MTVRTEIRWWLLCAILIATVGSGGTTFAQSSTPGGPAARQFAGWLAAFNQGDRAALLAYHRRWFPYSSTANPYVGDVVHELALRAETGGFEMKKSEAGSATSFTGILKERRSRQFARASMQVDAAAPHRVVSFDLWDIPTPDEYRSTPHRPLDAARRRSIVDEIARVIETRYILPEVGRKMVATLRDHAARGDYDKFTDGSFFAFKLTDDLQSVSHDLHFMVTYGQSLAALMMDVRALNFGFGPIERLQGNVGFMVINSFPPADKVREAVAGFMSRVADANALIIDLRENHGGDSETVALIASYLFDNKPVHLTDLVFRDGTTYQSWTKPNLPGKRFGGTKPVYILISARTVSGGEELAYDLQSLRRATLIGGKTAGAANMPDERALDDWFAIRVPNAHPINPMTKTNWEGVGVQPDVVMSPEAAADEAFRRAAQDIGFTPAVNSDRGR